MDNATLINAEQHKFWNSDSANYWISQKPALDQLLEPWARLLLSSTNTEEVRKYPLNNYKDEDHWLLETKGKD